MDLNLPEGKWTTEYFDDRFERFFRSLPGYQQAVLAAAIQQVLEVFGPDICASDWGKPLGDGLFEFRVSKSLNAILSSHPRTPASKPRGDRKVLIRLFCTFYGDKVVLVFHGYDKGKDASAKRQQREIARARAMHRQWKREHKKGTM